jgi:hypothetical protein
MGTWTQGWCTVSTTRPVPSRLVQAQHLFFLLLSPRDAPIARERQKNERNPVESGIFCLA